LIDLLVGLLVNSLFRCGYSWKIRNHVAEISNYSGTKSSAEFEKFTQKARDSPRKFTQKQKKLPRKRLGRQLRPSSMR
jgi:hypothetical protein